MCGDYEPLFDIARDQNVRVTHACDFNFDIFDTHETDSGGMRDLCERLTVPFYNCPDHANPPRPGTAEPNIFDVYTERARPKTIRSDI